jgi:uncharacterized membrane protein YfhO
MRTGQAKDRLGPRLWPLGGQHEGVLESWRDPLARAEYVFGFFYVCCKSSQEGLSSLSNNTNSITTALAAIKLSILLFYLMLVKEESIFRLGTYITLWVVLLSGFALTLVNLFPCRHRRPAVCF